jgi:glutaminase
MQLPLATRRAPLQAGAVADLQHILDEIAGDMAEATERGRIADYIPDLAAVDPRQFGIAVVDADGRTFLAGDATTRFSVQSITKVFSLTMALGTTGDALWHRVGREPSGTAFNSIVQLETEQGIPRNPFINAGAIVIADVLLARHEPRETIAEFVRFMRQLTGDDSIVIDRDVAAGEQATGFRNVALANYMRAFGNIRHPVEKVLGTYFHQCALAMDCRQLALAGRYLMMGGTDPVTGRSVVTAQRARRILALMLTCGHYDASGDFAFRVGLPGKSGVGGGILAIAPGSASIAVWSPGLDAKGNSLLGRRALERLVQHTGWSVFEPMACVVPDKTA